MRLIKLHFFYEKSTEEQVVGFQSEMLSSTQVLMYFKHEIRGIFWWCCVLDVSL